MQVGDLVKYRFEDEGIGVIVRVTDRCGIGRHYQVLWSGLSEARTHRRQFLVPLEAA